MTTNQVPNYAENERYTQGTHISSGSASAKRTIIDKNINLTTNQVPNYAATERYTKGNHISSGSASAKRTIIDKLLI